MRETIRWTAEVVSGVIILSLVLYVSVLRSSYYQPYYEERSRIGADWRKNGITVAVVWPPHQDYSFVHGFKTALAELNEAKGPLAGKVVETVPGYKIDISSPLRRAPPACNGEEPSR